MVLLSLFPKTLYISLLQSFLCCAVIVHEHFCLLLCITSSREAVCLIYLCVCRVRHIVSDLLHILTKRQINEGQWMGIRITLTTFLSEVDKNFRHICKTSHLVGQRAMDNTWLACPVTKELSQVRNVKSGSRTLNSHPFSGSSSLLLFSFLKGLFSVIF